MEAYTFNSVNKLTAYDSGDGTVATYHYDALGRRIAKVVDGAATAYVYDAWNPYSSVANDILLEYSNGVLTRRWLHGAKVDEPLAFEAYSGTTGAGTGALNEVFADRQGSILAVIDPVTGTKAAEYTYDSFGQLTQVTGTLSQPFAYTAREYDAETGLYYYRARYYDPALGQFVSADPIGFAAGDLNIYTYVENDPYNWTDPSGRTALTRRVTDRLMAQMTNNAISTIYGNAGFIGLIGSIMYALDQGSLPILTAPRYNDLITPSPPEPPQCGDGGGREPGWWKPSLEQLRVIILMLGLNGHGLTMDGIVDKPRDPFARTEEFQRKMDEWEDSIPKDEPSPGSDNNKEEDDC